MVENQQKGTKLPLSARILLKSKQLNQLSKFVHEIFGIDS